MQSHCSGKPEEEHGGWFRNTGHLNGNRIRSVVNRKLSRIDGGAVEKNGTECSNERVRVANITDDCV
jgi:hypothetical protein